MQISKKNVLVGFIIMMSLLTACGGGGDETSDIVATEKWNVTMDQGQGTSQWTIKKKADGTILAEGEFVYSYDGYPGRCPFVDGMVTLKEDAFTMTASGTATYSNPNIPIAYQTSPFTLFVDGSTGAYRISFTQTGWPSIYTGTGQPYLVEGTGITEEPETDDGCVDCSASSYDATGSWSGYVAYQSLNTNIDSSTCYSVLNDSELEGTATFSIERTGNSFKLTTYPDGDIFHGTVSNNTYTIIDSRLDDDGEATITLTMGFTLSSSNALSGSVTLRLDEDSNYCQGIYSLTASN